MTPNPNIITIEHTTTNYEPEYMRAWMASHGIEPELTYMLEIDTKRMMVSVYQYAVNHDGQRYIVRRGPAVREPFEMPVAWLPTPLTGSLP